jgi:hypothetical protein
MHWRFSNIEKSFPLTLTLVPVHPSTRSGRTAK